MPEKRPKAVVLVSGGLDSATTLAVASRDGYETYALTVNYGQQAYRLNEAGLIAPFEYVGMPMAIMWGVVVFGRWPDLTAWLGIALICGAGLYTLWRETVRKKDVDVAVPSGDL